MSKVSPRIPNTTNRDILRIRKKIKQNTYIIHAVRCINTEGKYYEDEYKKLRKSLSDKTILQRYNEIREEMGVVLVCRH